MSPLTGPAVDTDGTHPGFTITCDECGSTAVAVESSLGYSATSGGWGSVDLECTVCHHYVTIVENY